MKIQSYKFPQSSFLSVEKDCSLIVEYILKNERLKKLLYYPHKDALKRPNLTQEQIQELIENNIKIIPQIKIDEVERNYLVITFTDFFEDNQFMDYKSCVLKFDIIIPYSQYLLEDYGLRNYKIAAELDVMLRNIKLNTFGKIDSIDTTLKAAEDYSCLTVKFELHHFTEDKKQALSPYEQQNIKDNFNELYND